MCGIALVWPGVSLGSAAATRAGAESEAPPAGGRPPRQELDEEEDGSAQLAEPAGSAVTRLGAAAGGPAAEAALLQAELTRALEKRGPDSSGALGAGGQGRDCHVSPAHLALGRGFHQVPTS